MDQCVEVDFDLFFFISMRSLNTDAVNSYYGIPEWLQTQRPHGPFAAAFLKITMRTLFHLLLFFYLFSCVNKQT